MLHKATNTICLIEKCKIFNKKVSKYENDSLVHLEFYIFYKLPITSKFIADSAAFADDSRDGAMGQQQFRKQQNPPSVAPMSKGCTTCLGDPC